MKKEMKDRIQKKIEVQRQTAHYLSHSKSNELDKQNSIRDRLKQKSFHTLLDEAEKLERLFQFHTSIIQNMHSSLITIDIKGDITFANRSCEKLLNYSISELTKMNISELILSSNPMEEIIRIKHGQIEFDGITKDKTTVPLKMTIDNYEDESNAHEGYILVFKDNREEKLIVSQKQEVEKLTTLTEVSAGIAHELRNPLAGIKSISQVIESQSNDEVIDNCIERIINEVDRANALLQQFFKYAKPSEPKKQFESIDYIIERVITYFRDSIKKNKIDIELNLSETTPQIFADINQIEYCLTQMIENALDASPEASQVTIEKSLIHRTVLNNQTTIEKEFICISVIDDGEGITEENVGKIFNLFYTTHHFKTGLGLSISKRFIESNSGFIEFSLNNDDRTRFNLLIPIH